MAYLIYTHYINITDVIPVMPIFALFRNMMWVKTGRAQWVLIEEGAGDGCGRLSI